MFTPIAAAARRSAAAAVRVGCYAGTTEIRITNDVTEKLGLPVSKGASEVPILVAVGSAEHQGLIQVSRSEDPAARPVKLVNGKFGVRLTRIDIEPRAPEVSMSMTPVSFLVKDKVLTIELPTDKYEVSESAKAYMRSS